MLIILSIDELHNKNIRYMYSNQESSLVERF